MTNPHYFQAMPLNEKECLPEADINHGFLIESVMITQTWKIHIPELEGQERLNGTKEGLKAMVHVANDKLERPSQQEFNKFDLSLPKELEPLLSSVAVVRAIRKWHRIGSVWLVQ
ncbi:uncharacterized protein BDV14DRAFT_204548 [Aspergillus stella-maris]|uniref:uncharacterized protein n=1 Tax=Aspergillus stella-maris TaxID=1810926 RepID=UPI003CCD08B3